MTGKCKARGSCSCFKTADRRPRKTKALPRAAPAVGKAEKKTFALWLPVPSMETKTTLKRMASASHPGQGIISSSTGSRGKQTDAGTAAKPEGTCRCRARGTARGPAARALPSLQPGGTGWPHLWRCFRFEQEEQDAELGAGEGSDG